MVSGLVPRQSAQLVQASVVQDLLGRIRPVWQSKGLIQRVRRILPVDPSSACQRIFNAAIHDLRDKILIAGLDIARDAANDNKLPPIDRAEDVDRYPTSKILDLCFRMGLLTRADWRRMGRCYEIRRDLEHEDDEYEAEIADCVYIFQTCIEAVLERDPIELVRVVEVRDIIEAPTSAAPSAQLIEDFSHAPDIRQVEIFKFLVGSALDETLPDLVRMNSYNMLGHLAPHLRDSALVPIAQYVQAKIGRDTPTELQARVASAASVLSYLRRAQRTQLFETILIELEKVGTNWRANPRHGGVLRGIVELGGLAHIPPSTRQKFVKWLVVAYIGEPGGYGMGINRRVFYSNSAAPFVEDFIIESKELVRDELRALASDRDVKRRLSDEHVARRYQQLLDLVEE